MSKLLGSLDLKLLRVFEAVYTTRNVSRAAFQIGVSQPSMSNALLRLRDALGDPLFRREAHGVSPTSKADEIINPIRRILAEIDRIVAPDKSFDPTNDEREFRICILDGLEALLMNRLIRKSIAGKGVRFQLLPSAGARIDEALHSGMIDVAVNLPVSAHRELNREVLLPLDLVVVARKGHPKLEGEITSKQVLSLPHVTLNLDVRKMANPKLLRLNRRIEANRMVTVSRVSSILEIVAASDLIGVVSRFHVVEGALADKLQVFELPWKASEQSYHMTWHKRTNDDAGLTWLRNSIAQAAEKVRHRYGLSVVE